MRMSAYKTFQNQSSGRVASRYKGLVLVLGIHVGFFWALYSGLVQHIGKVLQTPVEAVLLEEPEKPPEPPPPPPPPPKKIQPPPFVPPPNVPVTDSQTPSATAISSLSREPKPVEEIPPKPTVVPKAEAPKPRDPIKTPAVVNASQCEKPEYPATSRKLDEQGTVLLRFLIDVNGTVTDSAVAQSSGFKRLDEAARAALSRCQFKPATSDGQPVQEWATLKYTWQLD